MIFDGVLLDQDDNGYSAHPVLWPEAVVHGASRQEVIDRVRAMIRDLLSRTQLVQVEVEVPDGAVTHPWLSRAGSFADDPTWDEFVRVMTDYRGRLDSGSAP